MMRFKIGTRGSKLALWQAHWVKEKIEELFAHVNCEIVVIKTKGDQLAAAKLLEQNGKGFFTKEIEEVLIDKRVDAAVHSAKDLPTEIPDDLIVGAIPSREINNDVLISKNEKTLQTLPARAKIGTSSLRRKSQLLRFRKDLEIVDLRGNLDTRIKKLNTTDLDGIIVAYAGAKRLNLEHLISETISNEIILPAVGQGAIAIEIRKNDIDVYRIVEKLNHKESWFSIMAERSFLRRLRGGCQVPVGAYGYIDDDVLVLEGMVSTLDGMKVIRKIMRGKAEDAEGIGKVLAEEILQEGGDEIMDEFRGKRTNWNG